jgi:hypothetical protein
VELRPGDTLAGRYLLEELIAKGGMGEVWRAQDQVLTRPVAIKVLLNPDDPDRLRRFRDEAKIAARLQHEGIAVVHDYGDVDSRPYIVMELLTGSQLQESLNGDHGLPVAHAVALGIQLAEALQYAHGEGIVHRDLKPANLMLKNGRLKICDFGIARDLSVESLTRDGVISGTPPYMAPELWRDDPTAASSDLYALGCILYAMVTGHPPFRAGRIEALMNHHLTTPPKSLRLGREDVPASLDTLVLALLSKRPEDRPKSAAEVASSLRRIQPEPGQRDAGGRKGSWWQRHRPRPRAVLSAAVVIVVAAAGIAAWQLYPRPVKPHRVPPPCVAVACIPPCDSCVSENPASYTAAFGPVVSAIAAENKAVRNDRHWVSVALLAPLTPAPNGSPAAAGVVTKQEMLDELFAAYLGQLSLNDSGDGVGVQLLLANAGDGREQTEIGAAKELIRTEDEDHLVAVTGLGSSIDPTGQAAGLLSRDSMLTIGALTTADEFRASVKPYELSNFYKVSPSVSSEVARLAGTLNIPGSHQALLVHVLSGNDYYVEDQYVDFQHSFQESEQPTVATFTPGGSWAPVAERECATGGQQGYILYAGRIGTLPGLITALEANSTCDGKRITIITCSDASELGPSATKPLASRPQEARVLVDYAGVVDSAELSPDYRSAFNNTEAAKNPGNVQITDEWGIDMYNAMIAAGMAIRSTHSDDPRKADVTHAASNVQNLPMTGATGTFQINGYGLLSAYIPVYQDSAGRLPAPLTRNP